MPILGVIASSAKGAPGIPTSVSATDVGTSRAYNNGAATVSFTPGAGATATSFTATSSPGGFTATGASSPLTVTGLQSGVSYTFTVTATNAAGTSNPSAASASITATTVPQAPTIGTATAGDASATVTYTANATGGKAVSAYTATSSPGSLTGTGASPITVSGLTNGTAYTFTVTATNANGTSTASAASNSVTPALGYAYNSIASYLTTAASTSPSSLSFTSIPQTYSHLQFRLQLQGSDINSYIDAWGVLVNGNSSNIYNYHSVGSTGGNPSADGLALNSTTKYNTLFASKGSPASTRFSSILLTILDYTNTSKTKIVRVQLGVYSGGNVYTYIREDDFIWNSGGAVTSMAWTTTNGDPVAGNTLALYGIS